MSFSSLKQHMFYSSNIITAVCMIGAQVTAMTVIDGARQLQHYNQYFSSEKRLHKVNLLTLQPPTAIEGDLLFTNS